MATLSGATTELVGVVAGVTGINHSPNEPQEQVTIYPAAYTYTTDGTGINEPADVQKDLHNIQIAVIMPLNDLVQCVKVMLPLYEPITKAIFQHRNGRTSSHYATFGNITYTLGPIEWAGQDMFGYVFTVQSVKIQNNI